MMRHAQSLVLLTAVLLAALMLCGCDVPAAGKPVLYADQAAQATDSIEVETLGGSDDSKDEAAAEDSADAFSPVESVGEGAVALCLENHLGATITSLSIRPTGTEDWPEETSYARLSIPNGSQFLLRLDAAPTDAFDLRYEGADGTAFLAIDCMLAAIAMDHRNDDIVMLRYDNGVTYVEYTNLYGLTIDTHLSAQEALASMRAQLQDKSETYTFTERDMEGVEAGQETENCLD